MAGLLMTAKPDAARLRELIEHAEQTLEALSGVADMGAQAEYGFCADTLAALRELEGARKGHQRYEYVRCLGPRAFKTLWWKNIKGEAAFDDLVDAAIDAAMGRET